MSDYEDARSTTTEKFQSACRKFFDADLNEKNKIVSCGIPPRTGIFGLLPDFTVGQNSLRIPEKEATSEIRVHKCMVIQSTVRRTVMVQNLFRIKKL